MDMRLIDADGMINPDGFYNYLTAWYNIDNMMYYVSQGQIFPPPPPWAYNAKVLFDFLFCFILHAFVRTLM